MSTRYGAVKPLAAVGPQGEALLDYTLFDAARSGYGGAVLVVRREIEDAVSRHIEELTAGSWPCRFVRQRLDDLPTGVALPPSRTKPWGTGHAVWSARDVVHVPFAVVNADDFYGRAPLEVLPRYLNGLGSGNVLGTRGASGERECLAVTYRLTDTLSAGAQVSRAILQADSRGHVQEIREVLRVHRTSSGIVGETPDGTSLAFSGDEPASMGLWGFTPDIFPLLEGSFRALLAQPADQGPPEFYLSDALNGLIATGDARVRAMESGVPSFGVTFPDDRSEVGSRIEALVAEGRYPANLRSAFRALTNQNESSGTEP